MTLAPSDETKVGNHFLHDCPVWNRLSAPNFRPDVGSAIMQEKEPDPETLARRKARETIWAEKRIAKQQKIDADREAKRAARAEAKRSREEMSRALKAKGDHKPAPRPVKEPPVKVKRVPKGRKPRPKVSHKIPSGYMDLTAAIAYCANVGTPRALSSLRTAYNDQRLAGKRIGRNIWVTREAIDAWLARRLEAQREAVALMAKRKACPYHLIKRKKIPA